MTTPKPQMFKFSTADETAPRPSLDDPEVQEMLNGLAERMRGETTASPVPPAQPLDVPAATPPHPVLGPAGPILEHLSSGLGALAAENVEAAILAAVALAYDTPATRAALDHGLGEMAAAMAPELERLGLTKAEVVNAGGAVLLAVGAAMKAESADLPGSLHAPQGGGDGSSADEVFAELDRAMGIRRGAGERAGWRLEEPAP